MNVNGRYVCVSCGSEIPENEIVTDALPMDFGSSAMAPQVGADEVAQSQSKVTTPELSPEIPSGIQTESQDNTENSVKISDLADIKPDQEAISAGLDMPEYTSVITDQLAPTESVEPVQITGNVIENHDNQGQIEQNLYSAPEATEMPENVQEVKPTESLEEPVSEDKATEEIVNSEISGDVGGDQPVSVPMDVPVDQTVAEQTELTVEAEPSEVTLPNETETPAEIVDNFQPEVPVSQPEPELQPVQPQAPSFDTLRPVQVSEAPAMDNTPESPQNTPVNDQSFTPDQAIYQDPIFDTSANPDIGESIQQRVQEKVTAQENRKKTIIFSIVGVCLVLVLSVGGFFAYKTLTAPVTPSVEVKDTWVDYTDDATNFTAKFPIEPESTTEDQTYGGTKINVTEKKGSIDNNQTQYNVNNFSLSQPVATDKKDDTLKAYLADFAKNVNGNVVESALTDVGENRAINFLVNGSENKLKGEVVLTDTNVYFVYVTYSADVPGDFDKFITSFSPGTQSEDENTTDQTSTE